MKIDRNWAIALAGVALVAAGGGYFLGRTIENPSATASSMPPMVSQSDMRTPVYYQDPDGKPDYSATPKKSADGRDYKPIYEEGAAANPSPAPQGRGRILYYRNPMGLPDTSPVPKSDPMGMAYVPVYENEVGADAGIVQVSPQRVQMLGVRTIRVSTLAALPSTIRATGNLRFNEGGTAVVTTKIGGWVEKLNVATTGEMVRAGQALLEIYSPEIVAAEQEYLLAAGMSADANNTLFKEAAQRRLRVLGVPEGEISRLERTGTATRRIAILAPANGVVTEKEVTLGMRVEPGTALYKTADLSSVWLLAQIQEQDIGLIARGQKASASFVAFPGRKFLGVVDFVYPTLSRETRTATVRVVILNPGGLLRTDMYASVEIEAGRANAGRPIIAVPNSAIIDSGKRQIVLVAKGDGKFEPRAVQIGARGDATTQILSGLKDGEEVVTSANFLIDAESNLRAALQAFTAPGKPEESAK